MRRWFGYVDAIQNAELTAKAADPVVGNQILQRRKEYQQAAVTAKIVGLLGSNVLIVSQLS
jgi:hypothetical protein